MKSIKNIKRGTMAFACFHWLVMSACGGSEPSVNASPAATTAQVKQETVTGFRLLDAGSEPRQTLRYDVQDGLSQLLHVDLIFDVEAIVEEGRIERALTRPVRLVVRAGPAEPKTGGTRFPLRIEDVKAEAGDLDAEARKAIDEEVAPLKGIRGTLEIDELGRTTAATFEVPSAVTPRTQVMLGNIRSTLMSTPLPREPVGIGARWEVIRPIQLGGVLVEQTVVYTLREFDAPLGKVDVTFRQTGKPQRVRDDVTKTDLSVDAYESSGLASTLFDLRRMISPAEADVTSQMRATRYDQGREASSQVRVRTGVGVDLVNDNGP